MRAHRSEERGPAAEIMLAANIPDPLQHSSDMPALGDDDFDWSTPVGSTGDFQLGPPDNGLNGAWPSYDSIK